MLPALRQIGSRSAPIAFASMGAIDRRATLARRRWLARQPTFSELKSQPCTHRQIVDPRCRAIAAEIDVKPVMHRKQWEWCFIIRALLDRGLVREGARGVGFGVGREPIVGALAARGCTLVATDLPSAADGVAVWHETQQHAASFADLDPRNLCDPELLRARVAFRPLDMRAIPADLTGFDFCWSACAFEHLGTLTAGLEFVERSLAALRPGGTAVHTTEWNVSSNRHTVESGGTGRVPRSRPARTRSTASGCWSPNRVPVGDRALGGRLPPRERTLQRCAPARRVPRRGDHELRPHHPARVKASARTRPRRFRA